MALLVLTACDQDPKPITQLVLVADTDVSTVDAVQFLVSTEDGSRTEMSTVPRSIPGPSYVSVVREEGPLGPVTVSSFALKNGERTGLSRVQRVSFVPDQTRVVKLHLAASCVGKKCAASETCSENGCTPIDLPPQALEPWTGAPPAIDDHAIADGGAPVMDGGSQEGGLADAANPHDAGVDASSRDAAISDAGSDAGDAATDPADAGLTLCSESWYNLQTDPYHCGTCTNKCAEITTLIDHSIYKCLQGVCSNLKCSLLFCDNSTQCQPLYGDCNNYSGCETYLGDDINNCGVCGHKCATGQTCILGICT